MSAPRFFPARLPILVAAALAAAVTAAGCAAPGVQRLQGAPEGMPPSLRYVTADVLGIALYATDEDAWSGSTGLAAAPVLEQLHGSIGMAPAQVEPWVGDHAGIAVRQLDVPGADDDTTAYVADVADRSKLESTLEEAGWQVGAGAPLPSVNGAEAALATRGDGRFTAAAMFDDGVLIARTEDGLRAFLEAADEYAVPERPAMSKYSAEVARTVPAGAVFRFDFVRTQLRRPFQQDPAMLEFARWATESRVLLATRDGWIGLAPGGGDDEARIIGAVEWVPDLAPDIEWGEADRSMLDPTADVSIALDDIGQHLTELVRGITFNNGQYATEQDVSEGEERVELEEVFEELDGATVVSLTDRQPSVTVRGGGDVARRVDDLLCEADIKAGATSIDGDLHGYRAATACDESAPFDIVGSVGPGSMPPTLPKPPSAPVIWLSARSIAGCTGLSQGWVTFDGEGEMQFAVGIDRGGVSYRPPTGGTTGREGAASGGIAPEFCDLGALVPFT